MTKYNDIKKEQWRDYKNILTDSLWLFDRRDNSGSHSGHYHGNFIPQVPNQLFQKYTKKGEWILDPFMGSGTSLIEAQHLERNSIGIELQKNVADEVEERIKTDENPNVKHSVLIGDSATIDLKNELEKNGIDKVQFVIFHPPYWDIIHFSKDREDISNSQNLHQFLESFGKIIDNTCQYLEKDRYCAVVIADKYANSEVVPLGFHCMNLFLERNFKMKAILVKNFGETKGKGNQAGIWKYRSLVNDFYVFKHEYIFVFKK